MTENANKGKVKFRPNYDEDCDEYDIDAELKKELLEFGFEYRFIDYKKAISNGNMSRSGWRIYVRVSPDPRAVGHTLSDTDGLTRQGSMVLAVKTKNAANKQRGRRDAQNRSLAQYNRNVAETLQKDVRRLGGNSKLIQGYENNS